MIQEKELRIGNYVNSIEFGLVKVYGISENIIQYKHEGDIFYGEFIEFQSIVLTPEILLKCGFHIFANHAIQYECIILMYEGNFRYKNSNIDIKYLHQLQNLYFALTGTELEININ